MVAGQVALLVVLLSSAGLLFKSFQAVTSVNAGFAKGALTVRLALPRRDYGSIERLSAFYRSVEDRVAAIPGVRAVAAVNQVPLNGALASADYKVADRPPVRDDQLPTAQYRMATPSFFRAMGIPVKAGRVFGDEDREGTALVAIVNEALVRQSFPDRDPVGSHLLVADTPGGFRSMEIVGVAEDVKHASLEQDAEPHLYVPYHQTHRELLVWLTNNQFLVVRTEGPPLAVADAVRREVAAVDPNVAAAEARTTDDYLETAAGARRFALILLGLFAAVALLMATIGLYGVVAGAVAQQARETGVRLALGASASHIVARVLGLGLRHAGLGIVVGLGAAGLLGRALHGLLFGVSAADPWTYAGVVLLLLAAALAACLRPAWRAAHADPLAVLRES